MISFQGIYSLHSGVDLNEVVAVLLVDQELGGTGIAVVDRLGQLHGVVEDGIAYLNREILCRSQLDDLLVATLHGAVTLVQVDDIAKVVTQQLYLNMLGPVQEAFDEDGAVAKGRTGLGGGTLERLLQCVRLPDDTHTTSTTAECGLDDDGKAMFVGERLDLLVLLHGAGGTRDDGDLALDCELSSRDLVAQCLNCGGRRPNELSRVSPSSVGRLSRADGPKKVLEGC